MLTTRHMRICARAVAIAGVLATSACGRLYESAEPSARDKIAHYLDGIETSGTDPRMPSLKSYAGTMATIVEMDATDTSALHETAVAMNKRQACLTQSWGWKAEEHSTAITKLLLEDKRAQVNYVAYLKEASDIPATRGNPCDF
jgi:hypothetical protein